jgi:hypothetical protein
MAVELQCNEIWSREADALCSSPPCLFETAVALTVTVNRMVPLDHAVSIKDLHSESTIDLTIFTVKSHS